MFNKTQRNNHTKGFSLVEIIVVSTVLTVGVLSLISLYNKYFSSALFNQKNTRASYVLEEGVETIYFLRNNSWASNIAPLETNQDYYLYWNNSVWEATTTPQSIDSDFTRSFTVEDVYRDGNDQISETGDIDQNTKKINMSVEYFQKTSTSTKSISVFVSNLYNN